MTGIRNRSLTTGLPLLVSAVVLLAGAVPAGARLRSGTVAVDYRASLRNSETPAYTTQIVQIVLAVFPAGVARVAGMLAIAAGLDAAVIGGVFYSQTGRPGLSEYAEPGMPMAGLRSPR